MNRHKGLFRAWLLVLISGFGFCAHVLANETTRQKAKAYESGLLPYQITVGPWITEYHTMSFFLLPGESVKITIANQQGEIAFTVTDGEKTSARQTSHSYTAPQQPGLKQLTLTPNGQPAARINLFTLVPKTRITNKKLNGYTIGEYPAKWYNNLPIYQAPQGFVEVTKSNQDIALSPHYTLKQFLCKQNEGYPKYVVLQTRLLRKLEYLTDSVNRHGIATNGFVIMSGYRTPWYNDQIKNKTYSRHQWGGAADVYIDESPKDGVMDDLNKDGKIDINDARWLGNLIESLQQEQDYIPFIGGMGIYAANAAHGPFVHVDVRGFKARW